MPFITGNGFCERSGTDLLFFSGEVTAGCGNCTVDRSSPEIQGEPFAMAVGTARAVGLCLGLSAFPVCGVLPWNLVFHPEMCQGIGCNKIPVSGYTVPVFFY